jgi:hypothetical protein
MIPTWPTLITVGLILPSESVTPGTRTKWAMKQPGRTFSRTWDPPLLGNTRSTELIPISEQMNNLKRHWAKPEQELQQVAKLESYADVDSGDDEDEESQG